MAPFYIAANSYEGCGHHHQTSGAAARCARRINRRDIPAEYDTPPLQVYRMTPQPTGCPTARRLAVKVTS